jgi:hypothetical protein
MTKAEIFKNEDVKRSLRVCGIISRIIFGFRYLNPDRREREDLRDIRQVDCDFWVETFEDDEDGEAHVGVEYVNPRTREKEGRYFGIWLNEDTKKMGFAFSDEPLEARQIETIKKIIGKQ